MKRVNKVSVAIALAAAQALFATSWSFARSFDVSHASVQQDYRSASYEMTGSLSCGSDGSCTMTVQAEDGLKMFRLVDTGQSAQLFRAGARNVAVNGMITGPNLAVTSIRASGSQ